MKNSLMKKALGLLALLIISGCSSTTPTSESSKLPHLEDVMDGKRLLENGLVKDDIRVDQHIDMSRKRSLKSILEQAGDMNNIYFHLISKDMELPAVSNYKIKVSGDVFNNINNFVKSTTAYELFITTNEFRKDKIKKVEIRPRDIGTSKLFEAVKVDALNMVTPAAVYVDIMKYTGYRIIDTANVKDIFHKATPMMFSGNYREFLEYFSRNLDVFVDIDYAQKEIVFSKYKTRFFKLKMPLDKYKMKNNVGVDNETGAMGGGGGSMGGAMQVSQSRLRSKISSGTEIESETDLLASIMNPLEKILPKSNQTEERFWSLSIANNGLIVTAEPSVMERVEEQVEIINKDFGKQLLVTLNIYEVNLNNKFQYGINWSYINNAFNADGTLRRALQIGTNSMTYGTESISSPSILKMGHSGGGMGALLNMLNQFGSTSALSKLTKYTLNNVPIVVNEVGETMYIKSQSFNAFSTTTTQVAREQDVAQEGLYFNIKPTVMDDEIQLVISHTIGRIINIDRKTFEDGSFLESPTTKKRNEDQIVRLRSGETIVIGGMLVRNHKKTYSGASPFEDSEFSALAGEKGTDDTVSEIVMQITVEEV